jgi:LPXTG-motif cell wall-anchored protein
MTSVSPAPGFIIFAAGTLLILSGGILLVRRGKRPRAVEELPQVNLS